MPRSCYAPACQCEAPCDAYYADDEDAPEEPCPGRSADCTGCTSCHEQRYQQFFRVSRRDRLDNRGRPIRAGEVYGVLERIEYQRGGPILRRDRWAYAFSPLALRRWVTAGSPKRPHNGLFHSILACCW